MVSNDCKPDRQTCNDSAPFYLHWTETMLKHKKSLRYSLRDCLANFLLLPISIGIHKNSENIFVLQWKH